SLGRDKGKRSEVYYLLGKYFCHEILFTYSLHYVDFFSSFTDDKAISLLFCKMIGPFSLLLVKERK
ncbi:MAG: hypothetical protein U0N87_01645, partial [Anaerobutyricum sp.]